MLKSSSDRITHHISLGRQGERIAAEYLKKRGWRIAECNFRAGRGEIDCIAWDGDVLVFVEVKTRKSKRYGAPIEAITFHKQSVLRRAAEAYLVQHEYIDVACRFDVIEVMVTEDDVPRVTYWRNAF